MSSRPTDHPWLEINPLGRGYIYKNLFRRTVPCKASRREHLCETAFTPTRRIHLKIGLVSLPVIGHIHPMTALARTLNQRGHEAVFFGVPDIEPVVRAAGVTFVPYGEKEFPKGSIPKLYAPLASARRRR